MEVGKEIWSSTNSKTSVENAFKHWKDHKNEFPELFNAKQYGRSHSLLQHSEGILTKTRSNGEILRYEPTSNTFGSPLQGLESEASEPAAVGKDRDNTLTL